MAREVAVYTVATQSYFHFAKTLMESIERHEWDVDAYVFLVDGDPRSPELQSDLFVTLSLDDLFTVPPKPRLFRYTAQEMSASIKPIAMEHLFRLGYGKVIFLDADTLVLGPVDTIVSRLDHAEVLLTPHITEPLVDASHPNELDIIRAGTMNSGFFAARICRGAEAFLKWWQGKLATQCIKAIEEGVHVEQKWLDLAPSLFPGVCIDRSPDLNVAYWNLAHREVTQTGGSYFVGDAPLIFFHFSGVLPENPTILSMYDGRFSAASLPPTVGTLLRYYIGRLKHNGLEEYRRRLYRYDFFSDRVTLIPPAVRKMYRDYEGIQKAFADDPFDESRDPGFAATYNRLLRTEGPPLTWLAYEIYRGSDELRRRFPLVPGLDTHDYLGWLSSVMAPQCGLSEAFLKPLRPPRPHPSASLLGPFLRTTRSLARQALIYARSSMDRFDPPHYDRTVGDSLASTIPQQARGFRGWMSQVLGRTASRIRRTPWMKRTGVAMLDSIQSPPMAVARRIDPLLSRATATPPGLRVVGMLHAQTGLGESARSTIRAATAAGLPVEPVNLNSLNHRSPDEKIPSHVPPDLCMPCPINVVNVNGNFFQHAKLVLGERFFEGRYNIAFWVWEMQYFPPSWRRWLPHVSEIWTPSTFSQDALSKGADVPVVRIPHCVSPQLPAHIGRSDLGLPEEGFIFLFSMDFHSIPERKNPVGVVEAFIRAFGRNTPGVYLCLKLSSAEHRPDVMKRLDQTIRGCGNIILKQDNLNRQSMNALIDSCDSYVSLHCSEGFGLPLAEAMALGKPVIATGWSGNMDFMNVGNSFPVRFELVELLEDVDPFEKGHSWAAADLDHAAQLMRDLVKDRDLADHIGRKARAHMLREFSTDRVGQTIKARIDLLPLTPFQSQR
jgi:glycosyltransferase involved in cell wall biosynthesis